MNYLIIGADAAGLSAANRIRSKTDGKITVIEKGRFISYAACGMPYFIGDEIESYKALLGRSVEYFKKKNIDVITQTEALEIDRNNKIVYCKGQIDKAAYDKLLIATGAEPFIPPIRIDSKKVFTLKTIEDAIRIKDFIKNNAPKKVAIIGAGAIGVEMAEQFGKIGLSVLMIERLPQILPIIDSDLAGVIQNYLTELGIEIKTGVSVESIEDFDKAVITSDAGRFSADFVLLSVGVKPNNKLAESAGVKLGYKGAIAVDRHMKTSDDSIYAAGDCAQTYHRLLGNRFVPLGTTANKQGRIAGLAMSGEDVRFSGVVGSAILRCFDKSVARSGIGVEQAARENIPVKSVTIKSGSKAHYYPTTQKMIMRIVFKDDGTIVGAQIVGGGAERINTLAMAIAGSMKLDELYSQDFAYSPPFSPVWDPILVAAYEGLKKL